MSSPKTLDRPKTLVIVTYFGTFGPWFHLYLHSLSRQRSLDLLLVTDAPTPPLPSNARRVEMGIEDLRDLAAAQLGTAVTLPHVRKLNDLKPAYGLVFESYTRGYDYWAYGDEDVFYGDIDGQLTPRLLERPDLVVPSNTNAPPEKRRTIGHFTLVRNEPRISALAMTDPDYTAALASNDYWAYDETGWLAPDGRGSFSKVVRDAEARGELTVNWGLPVRGDIPWPGRSLRFDGRGIREQDGTEIAYYHWGRMKAKTWTFPTIEQAEMGFVLDRYGFFYPTTNPLLGQMRLMAGVGHKVAHVAGRQLRHVTSGLRTRAEDIVAPVARYWRRAGNT